LGFDLTGQSASDKQPSNPLRLTLYWQAVARPTADYTVFAHVRDATGETIAQQDSPPVGGNYPTSLWDAGEIVKDELVIPLEQVKAGRYEVVVGLYDFATGARLSVQGREDNTILLQRIEVSAP
jgi:hypothetical protein